MEAGEASGVEVPDDDPEGCVRDSASPGPAFESESSWDTNFASSSWLGDSHGEGGG